jgi:putative glycosyltransferase
MKLSVITTMYRSRNYLHEFYNRIVSAANELKFDYELIFVDDGSPDDSLKIALQLQEQNPKIKVIELSRNFGHHKAIMAGLRECCGDLVFLIDCDLEEDPELLIRFYEKMIAENCDVVYGVQKSRKGNWHERFFGYLFYKMFNYFAYHKIPVNTIMARLMTSDYVKALTEFDEREFFLASTFVHAGFDQRPMEVLKGSKGSSTYDISKKIQLMVNAIVSDSNKPLVLVFYLGAFICLCAVLGVVAILYYHLFIEKMRPGWPSLILSIWFLGGLIILCIGVVGVYLSKVYSQTKGRPTTQIKKKHVNEN